MRNFSLLSLQHFPEHSGNHRNLPANRLLFVLDKCIYILCPPYPWNRIKTVITIPEATTAFCAAWHFFHVPSSFIPQALNNDTVPAESIIPRITGRIFQTDLFSAWSHLLHTTEFTLRANSDCRKEQRAACGLQLLYLLTHEESADGLLRTGHGREATSSLRASVHPPEAFVDKETSSFLIHEKSLYDHLIWSYRHILLVISNLVLNKT